MNLLFVIALLAADPSPLDGALDAYFAGRLDDASAAVDRVEATELAQSDPAPERPALLLLRAAIRLKRGDRPGATAEAERALRLDPTLKADAFPPSVQELAETVRLGLPPRVIVRLAELPEDGEARVDGRLVVAGVIAVLPGSHRLVVRRPEVTARRSFEARTDLVLRVSFPVPRLAGTPPRIASAPSAALPAGVWLGASAVAAAGSAIALRDLAMTRGYQQSASPGARGYYDRWMFLFAGEAAVGIGAAAITGTIGIRRLHPFAVPERGGGVVGVSADF